MRLFAQAEEFGQDLLVQAVKQEAALAVERTARQAADDVADEAGGHGGVEQHGIAAGGQAACVQTADRAFGGGSAYLFHAVEFVGRARQVVPIIALHAAVAVFGHHGARHAVARALLVLQEAVAVAVNKLVMRCLDARAFGVFDAAVGLHGGGFAAQGEFHRVGGGQIPFVVFVQIAEFRGHQLRVGQARAIVAGRVAGDVQCGLHRFFDGAGR